MNVSDQDLDAISGLSSQDEQLDYLSKKYPDAKFNVDNKGIKIGDTYLPSPVKTGSDYYSPEAIAARQAPFEGNQFGQKQTKEFIKENALPIAGATIAGLATGGTASIPAYMAATGGGAGIGSLITQALRGKKVIPTKGDAFPEGLKNMAVDTASGAVGGAGEKLVINPLINLGKAAFTGIKSAIAPAGEKAISNMISEGTKGAFSKSFSEALGPIKIQIVKAGFPDEVMFKLLNLVENIDKAGPAALAKKNMIQPVSDMMNTALQPAQQVAASEIMKKLGTLSAGLKGATSSSTPALSEILSQKLSAPIPSQVGASYLKEKVK